MSEKRYDDIIAPRLKDVADFCRESGLPFVAVVEYEPDSFGQTVAALTPDRIAMTMVHLAAQAKGNIDALVISLVRYVTENTIEHNSIVLERAGCHPTPKYRVPP